MDPRYRITGNWLTQKIHRHAGDMVLLWGLIVVTATVAYLFNFLNAEQWMTATNHQVFTNHQYWRLWTTLFAHADLGHLIGNSFLLLPLIYYLSGYFGLFFFPLLGIIMGGIINIIVLKTMPEHVTLLGISGVVNWLGAVWLTLYVLIDRRESWRRRFAVAVFLTVMLFAPEAYKPQISYLSHFLGYFLGVCVGVLYYLINRKKFAIAEAKELIVDHDAADNVETTLMPVVVPLTEKGIKEWNTDN